MNKSNDREVRRRQRVRRRKILKYVRNVMKKVICFILIVCAGIFLLGICLGKRSLPWAYSGTDIVLDAGHGGKDQGAGDSEAPEKEINLKIAQKVREYLKDSGYKVTMTRKTDVYISLAERAEAANKRNAQVFVSIHCNSAEVQAEGIETFYGRSKDDGSEVLAGKIQKRLIQETNAKDREIKEADYAVIERTNMPAALVEVGFLNNAEERNLLKTEEYQEKLAKGIAAGIIEYLESIEK